MALKLTQRHTISVGDTDVVEIDYTDRLRGSEVLTGAPTVDEQTTSDLTFGSVAVNTSTFLNGVNNRTVAVGAGVQFSVLGGTKANSPYTIRVTVSTDGTPARTMVRDIELSWA